MGKDIYWTMNSFDNAALDVNMMTLATGFPQGVTGLEQAITCMSTRPEVVARRSAAMM